MRAQEHVCEKEKECTMRMTAMFVGALMGSAMGLTACSVQNRTVANNPPEIKRGLSTFDTDFGTLSPESISIFLWPEWNEEEAREKVRLVKGASRELDRLLQTGHEMKEKKTVLEGEWSVKQCVVKWAANLGEDDDPDLIDHVTKWKVLEPVPEVAPVPETDPMYADYRKYQEYLASATSLRECQNNQDQRDQLQPLMDKNASTDQAEQQDIIFKTIDPTYPTQVNYKSVDPKGSKIVLRPGSEGSVEITLKSFLRPGNLQSTFSEGPGRIEAATYDFSTKLLKFSVPEIDEEGQQTGAMYEFKMERAPDFLGKARFAGDVKLTRGGQVLRHGSAKFEGPLK